MTDPFNKISGTVMYDDSCGLCRTWVLRLEKYLNRINLDIAPLTDPHVSEIQLRLYDGQIFYGADVYRFIFKQNRWTYPIYVASKLPVLNCLFDWGYKIISQHRHRFSKACGLRNKE